MGSSVFLISRLPGLAQNNSSGLFGCFYGSPIRAPGPRPWARYVARVSKNKWYVVWSGRQTGVFTTWTACQAQVVGYPGAKYKSFKSRAEAETALKRGFSATAKPSSAKPSVQRSAPTSASKPRYADHKQALADGRTVIYSDGGCDPNPGPGGYGVVLMTPNGVRQEASGGYRETTNNRMELMGWIEGLKLTEPRAAVAIFSDSKYVGDMYAKGFAAGWRDRGWKTSGKKPAANADLWSVLLKQTDERDVVFTHVYGHTGVAENERCDELTHEARRGDLAVDTAYESGKTSGIDQASLF